MFCHCHFKAIHGWDRPNDVAAEKGQKDQT